MSTSSSSSSAPSSARTAPALNPKAAVPILLLSFVFCLVIDNGFKFMTLPIAQDLGISTNTASLQASLAGIVIGIGAVVYAALADVISIRKLMIVGIVLMAIGSLVGFFFQGNWPMVLTGRIIQTCGLAAAETLYVIYVTKHLSEKDQKTYLGFSTSAFQLALLFGTLTSGFVATYISWTAMFLIALIALLAIPVILKTVPEEASAGGRMDIFGLFLVAVVATSVMLYMQEFKLRWLLLTVAGIALFIWHISTHSNTVVRPEFFHNGRYVWALVIVLILYSTQLGLSVIVIPGAVENVHGGDLAQASLVLAPGYAAGAVVGALSGQVAKVLNSRQAIITAIGMIILSLVLTAVLINTNLWVLSLAMILFSAGFAVMYAPLVNSAVRTIPAAKTGIAIGFYNLTINIAVPLGIAYSAKLVEMDVRFFGGDGPDATYSSVLWLLVLLSAIALAVYIISDRAMSRSEARSEARVNA
ncbi:MFS transporter [Corynebacterium sp. 11A]|uniref:MFS transporter n=1 Tax=Corynebacterium sp. 11A TaxID=2080510 RepID=UPI00124E2AA5|nr:MFS transporter [Corynebacterium sp. 11A]